MLAGELARAGGDHRAAFAAYESTYRDHASVSQKVNAGRLLAPRTRVGIVVRNRLLTALGLFSPLMRRVHRPASNLRLEDHDRIADVRAPA